MRRISARGLIALIALVAAALAPMGASVAGPAGSSPPKNVILFIVDGMGPEQIALGRAMKGSPLFVDGIPWQTKGTLDTDSLEGVTDSAAGATALASGAETNNGWLGMVPTSGGGARSVPTALERAEANGKATGLVSDSYITDATPAAFSAHVTSRSETTEIARQTAQQGIEFLFGGGRRQGSVGPLLDRPGVTYVRNTREMNAYVNGGGAGPVYGFFGSWNMAYNLDRDDEGVTRTEPTLPQMTSAALSVLSKDQDGFFLMVEGGLVDWGGHARDAASMGVEMIETDEAVKTAYDWAKNRTDTLIVFTADHETGDFDMTGQTDVAKLRRQTATTEYMWGLIKTGSPIRGTVRTYTGIDPTSAEIATIQRCGEHGISDVLSSRAKVTWNGTCTQEGDHTSTFVPVWAWGPGHADFAGNGSENELVGQRLLAYYGG
ncbi:MAG TPA: alkaline phosphatase [Actinomycetota bacterium]|nr:alkaline phosphatase [Actinomycetota bacterium]